MKIETLRWVNNKLEMIDQRVLPASFQYLAYDSAASVAEGIRNMVVRGAPAIGVAAAYGVALEALRLSLLNTSCNAKDRERSASNFSFYPLHIPHPARGWFVRFQSRNGNWIQRTSAKPPDGSQFVLGIAADAQSLGKLERSR